MTEQTTSDTRRSQVITKFWRHIFGGQRGLLHTWTAKRGADGRIDRDTIVFNNFRYPNAATSAATWALEKSEQGREVYFCAHLLVGAARSRENAGEIISLWGEYDGQSVPNGELRPTTVVESSPGHYHAYWRLTDPIPPYIAEQLNKRIARATGADPSGYDLSQLLRVPYTVNHKYEERPVVEILELDGSRSYDAEELDTLLPAIEEPEPKHEPEDGEEEPPIVLSPEALKVWRGEDPKYKDTGEIDRSASLMKIARVLYEAGANKKVIVTALEERDTALGHRKYVNNRDGGQREYERIYRKLKAKGRAEHVRLVIGGRRKEEEPQQELVMEEAAYRGRFGEVVETVEPHIEGDPVAVLASTITAFGNALGRGPYVQIGATRHYTNLFCGIVGKTAKGRKGTTWAPTKNIMYAADQRWAENRIASGLSSGEGLINEIRDPIKAPDKDGNMKVVDPGVKDKRLFVMEGEIAQALKVIRREGNTLSPIMRNAWDSENLRTMVKHSPLKATEPHISILGHITEAELVRYLTETETANGLANRFLWLLVKRSKLLPFGGEWHTVDLAPISRKITAALEYANRKIRMTWAEDAKPLWRQAYELLTEDRPGMFGAVTARAEAQTLRLAMLYALADLSQEIQESHVESALAVWQYAEESARRIFGDAIGDPDADKVLTALKETEGGMTRTEIRDLFGRNKGSEELERIMRVLRDAGRVRITKSREGESKKPVERWYAA